MKKNKHVKIMASRSTGKMPEAFSLRLAPSRSASLLKAIISTKLSDVPGVYIFKNVAGEIIYVGKASSLKRRVSSYWQKGQKSFRPIEQMINEVVDIETRKTGTVIEALIAEAVLIKKYWPKYNIVQRDDKSFLYVGVTRDTFPRVILLRGLDIERDVKYSKYSHLFGPFTSARSIRVDLDIVRKIFPWSDCLPPIQGKRNRACFYEHLDLCPGVCTGKISVRDYKKIIKNFVLFFQGKRVKLLTAMHAEMERVARSEDFERATELRNQITHLEHIQDIALLQREDTQTKYVLRADTPHTKSAELPFFRIEAYDISNISGTNAVGSMTVFENGTAAKKEYRKFKIKTVKGANDVAMMHEILRRRFQHTEWRWPDLVVIDGGKPQLRAARAVWHEFKLTIPLMGIAKGPTRKRDEFILAERNTKLMQFLRLYPHIVKQVRDEAHRFAVSFHRHLRGKL